MFKASLLAASALAEQTFNWSGYVNEDYNNSFPAVTTPLTFVQTAGQENFQILMDGTTKGVPDPPQLNSTALFTVGGLATHPIDIASMQFQCYLFGAKVYDETYSDANPMAYPGTVWDGTVGFDVPSVAPNTNYDININGLDVDGTILWSLQTAFKF